MKFSYNWITELVEGGLELEPRELERLITMKTAECEGVEPIAPLLRSASVAKVTSAEPIEGSHNQKAVVSTERYGVKTVVCGAPNCKPGMRTVYVPIGRKTIDGVESDGMLASGAELGISRDHEGIVDLADQAFDLKPDAVIDIDNKSITHRPDLWGHVGMAREVAAFSGGELKHPARTELLPEGPGAVGVEIENLDFCPRYSALVFDNVTVQPSPLWLQYRLEAIGLNPINNIVDFTNLIMAELGQPTHAFDRALLKGNTIFIRPARKGESIILLNDEEYQLSETNVMIADEGGPIALAGVMGGRDSAINENTKSIVLESACFQASNIRKTSTALKLRTDASMRFEKSQDPENTVLALARAMELLPLLSPGIRVVGGVSDQRKPRTEPAPITLPLDWLARKLGRTLTAEQVRSILESLSFQVEQPSENILEVRVPSWRATKDISIKDDLVEEVGRMIGYDSITPAAPSVKAGAIPRDPQRLYFRNVRARLTALGFTEVSNYSFISDEQAAAFGMKPEEHVEVANPIASDQTLMRKTLLPGIRKNFQDNSRHFDEFRFFEIGREIHKRDAGLPDEVPHLVLGHFTHQDGGLYELKHAAEALLPGVEIAPAEPLAWEHPARAARVIWQSREVGRLFEFHPQMVESGRASVLDLDLRIIQELGKPETRYQSLRRFPSSAFDLSVLAPLRDLAGHLQKQIVSFIPADRFESIEFVRQYSGPPLPEGQKSVSFRITVGSAEKTLSADEVGAIRTSIIEGMRAQGYELRV